MGGGSGGPLVNVESRCIVGILSKSNVSWDTKVVMIAKAKDLIESCYGMKKMEA